MNAFELLDELLKKSDIEIDYALLCLLRKKKIDFIRLSNLYTQYLEESFDDCLNQLVEAETCVMESFIDKKIVSDSPNELKGDKLSNYQHTQRSLYLLNQSKRFNMDSLNNKFRYNEDIGKQMSCYERNKE